MLTELSGENMTESTIVYVGPYNFPDGGAAARRILGNCKTLDSLGYNVIVTSGQMEKDGPERGVFEGFCVESLNERSAEKLPKLLKHFSYLTMGKKTIQWLDLQKEKPKAIILYSGYTPYLLQLLPWCSANKVPLIFDAVEWYEPQAKWKTFVSPYYINIEFAMRYLSPKVKNVIAISGFLERYYNDKHCNTIKIPPTLDTSVIKPNGYNYEGGKLRLAYAGSPGHKDLFDNVLDAVFDIDETGDVIELNIAGITEEELLRYPSVKKRDYTALPKSVRCYGRVPHDKATEIVGSADFSVLLRPQKKYAMAGFPTKFVESMAVGTPIITNLTSDLGDYLTHGIEGLVSSDFTAKSIEVQIRTAVTLSEVERLEMRKNARDRAEKSFDIYKYQIDFEKFLSADLLVP